MAEVLEGTLIEPLAERFDHDNGAVSLVMNKAWANVVRQALTDAAERINYIPQVRAIMQQIARDIAPKEESKN